MRRIDELFMKYPFYGSRQMVRQLRRDGVCVGRHRVRRLMRLIGLEAIYQASRTSVPHPMHRIYPYLLKGMAIDQPNRVWCADITYIPVQRGFLYLVAIMDWATRHVLSWRLSNTMDAGFCAEALGDALARHSQPEIFNPGFPTWHPSAKLSVARNRAKGKSDGLCHQDHARQHEIESKWDMVAFDISGRAVSRTHRSCRLQA